MPQIDSVVAIEEMRKLTWLANLTSFSAKPAKEDKILYSKPCMCPYLTSY